MNVSYERMSGTLFGVLMKYGFSEADASSLAEIFTDNTFDGVFSHGIKRFPGFVQYVELGLVKPRAKPARLRKKGNFEQWDGRLGAGPLNALRAMDRAVRIAKRKGFSLVTLRNTNHWMRAATYGLYAASRGMLSVSFTNTKANMPPWGAKEPRIGNNPFVLAVPDGDRTIILDTAISQYSYGKLSNHLEERRDFPFPGGFDADGRLTVKPEAIAESGRMLPIGYWKGSGLSLLLDLFVSILSDGRTTREIEELGGGEREFGISQAFMCFNPDFFGAGDRRRNLIRTTLEYVKGAALAEGFEAIRYPGERSALSRKEHFMKGVELPDDLWRKIAVL